jgi:hypothetical protein
LIIVTRTDSSFEANLKEAIRAREEGRYADALPLVRMTFEQGVADDSGGRATEFIPMLEWEWLAESYPPARDALREARDGQVRRLLAGDEAVGTPVPGLPQTRPRFALVARMNEALKESLATYELFAQLDAKNPGEVPYAFLALEAVVDAGDFTLAARYLPDPLGWIEHLNGTARHFPLFPPNRTAPRLAAELSNFARDLRVRAAVLRGLGREAEARALVGDAHAGLASDELRDWLPRELDTPGAIIDALTDHQAALDLRGRDTSRQP